MADHCTGGYQVPVDRLLGEILWTGEATCSYFTQPQCTCSLEQAAYFTIWPVLAYTGIYLELKQRYCVPCIYCRIIIFKKKVMAILNPQAILAFLHVQAPETNCGRHILHCTIGAFDSLVVC